MDPKTLINILVEISELEQLQLRASEQMNHNEELKFSLEELQAEYEADAAKAARDNEGTKVTVRSLENEIRQVSELLKVKKDLLVGLIDNRQVRAIKEEISSLKMRLDRLEDDTIELLNKQDKLKTEARESVGESISHGKKTKDRQEAMVRDSAELGRKNENIKGEIKRLVGMLPSVEGRAVQQLMKKLDQAVVHHQDGACLGCFNQMPRQQAIIVDQGREVVRCPSCRRFLVHKSWN